MSDHLNNDEIREKLLKYKQNCGPVTDTTREVHLKKLKDLGAGKTDVDKDSGEKMTDEELRSQLVSFGESVGPITPTTRPVYTKRLQKLKNAKNNPKQEVKSHDDYDDDGWEPMDVDIE